MKSDHNPVETTEDKVEAVNEILESAMILAGSVAHDLRTPLATINALSGGIKLILPSLLDGYTKAKEAGLDVQEITPEQLNVLNSTTKMLQDTVNEASRLISMTLKTLHSVITGAVSKEFYIPCSMEHCVAQTLQHFPLALQEKERIHFLHENDFFTLGNPVVIIRVLIILLKYVFHHFQSSQNGNVFFSIEPGMPKSTLRITAEDVNLSSTELHDLLKLNHDTESGLPYCKHAMKDLGGDISYQVTKEGNTSFFLIFPTLAEEK